MTSSTQTSLEIELRSTERLAMEASSKPVKHIERGHKRRSRNRQSSGLRRTGFFSLDEGGWEGGQGRS